MQAPKHKLRVVLDRFAAASMRERLADSASDQAHHQKAGGLSEAVRSSVFGQAFMQISDGGPVSFHVPRPTGSSPHTAFELKFKGEKVEGEGGPYRQFFTDICRELMPPGEETSTLPLFVACANKQVGIGTNREKYIPAPSSDSAAHLSMFRFFGRLLGCAVRTDILMPLDLPSFFWKPLVGQVL